MVKARIYIDPSTFRQAERILDRIDEMVRGPAITTVMRGLGLQIKRDLQQVLPKPGYPGDKPELTSLRDAIPVNVKNYHQGAVKVLVVGYAWPEGAHGQPLEAGHEKWLWGEHIEGSPVDAYPYLTEVVQMTKVTQESALIAGARQALERAKAKR